MVIKKIIQKMLRVAETSRGRGGTTFRHKTKNAPNFGGSFNLDMLFNRVTRGLNNKLDRRHWNNMVLWRPLAPIEKPYSKKCYFSWGRVYMNSAPDVHMKSVHFSQFMYPSVSCTNNKTRCYRTTTQLAA